MKKQRESNYELLRILAMIGIVLGHIIILGHTIDNTNGLLHAIFKTILFVIIIHVNIFILITGYFQYDKPFKYKKVINLLLEVFFYKLLIDLSLYFRGLVKIPNNKLILDIFPLNLESYWFVANYILLYMLSPYINKLIKSLNKEETIKYIITILLCFSIIPYFSLRLFIGYNGYSLCNMFLMYSIGAILQKYNVVQYIKENYKHPKLKILLIFISSLLINITIFIITKILSNSSVNIISKLSNMINELSLNYNNIFIIIQAISIFILFGMFNIHSKIINKIASCTLAVYLLHENPFMREHLYKWIGIDTGTIHNNYSIILEALFWALAIFIIGIIIELIRKKLFKILRLEFK